MTDKEKLLKIILDYEAKYVVFCDGCLEKEPEHMERVLEAFVDHLINNGVTMKE